LEWEGLSCGAMRCGAGGNSVGCSDNFSKNYKS
jgi:hypothetical protein